MVENTNTKSWGVPTSVEIQGLMVSAWVFIIVCLVLEWSVKCAQSCSSVHERNINKRATEDSCLSYLPFQWSQQAFSASTNWVSCPVFYFHFRLSFVRYFEIVLSRHTAVLRYSNTFKRSTKYTERNLSLTIVTQEGKRAKECIPVSLISGGCSCLWELLKNFVQRTAGQLQCVFIF
jgi:hypothetical protein